MQGRRGISTIVGSTFFLILLIAGMTALITVLTLETNMAKSIFTMSTGQAKKIQEQFAVYPFVDSTLANKLTVNINNMGGTDLKIQDLWIIGNTVGVNTTAINIPINLADSNVPIGSTVNIIASQTKFLTAGTYTVKAVTSSGTIVVVNNFVVSAVGACDPTLLSKLTMIPPQVASGSSATLLMTVLNNGSSPRYIVQPSSTNPTFTITTGSIIASTPSLTSPSSNHVLYPGDSFTYSYNYVLSGSFGSIATVSQYAVAKNLPTDSTFTVTGCSGTTNVIMNPAPAPINPGTSAIGVAVTPTVYIAYSAPFGGKFSNYWAITVSNPTNQPMTISQVTVAGINPTSSGSFMKSITGIQPSDAVPNSASASWKIPTGGASGGPILMWVNPSSPITIQPSESYSFIAWVTFSGTGNSNVPQIMINVSVATSNGQFWQNAYSTQLANDQGVPNIAYFMSSDHLYSCTGSTSNSCNPIYYLSGISSGSQKTINMTILNTGAAAGLGNAYVNVVIPSGWTNIQNNPAGFTGYTPPGSSTVFTVDPMKVFQDGTTIIPLKLSNGIGGSGCNPSCTYSFVATAPTVTTKTTYMFGVFSSSTFTDTGNIITTPLATTSQMIVQVVP